MRAARSKYTIAFSATCIALADIEHEHDDDDDDDGDYGDDHHHHFQTEQLLSVTGQ